MPVQNAVILFDVSGPDQGYLEVGFHSEEADSTYDGAVVVEVGEVVVLYEVQPLKKYETHISHKNGHHKEEYSESCVEY